MKQLIILFFAFSSVCVADAQVFQRRIDSLQTLLDKASSDTLRSRLQGELSGAYTNLGNPAKAYALANKALSMQAQMPYNYYKALAHYRLAYIHLMTSSADSAIVHYNIARNLLIQDTSSTRSKDLLVRATNNVAFAYDNKGYSEKALELVISILPVIAQMKDTVAYGVALHNISASLTTLKQYSKAYSYNKKDIALTEIKKDPERIASAYLSGALLLNSMDSLDKTKTYLDKAKEKLILVGKTSLWGRYYSYLTDYYTKLKKYTLAEEANKNAFKELKLYSGSRTNQYDAYDAQKTLFFKQGKYEQARQSAYVIEKMAKEDSLPEYILQSLKDIADFSKRMGDLHEAYKYLDEYTTFKDSIDKKQVNFKMGEMEASYRSSEKEKQILALKNDKKQQQFALQKTRFITVLLVIGIIAVLLTLFFVWKLLRSRQLASQQEQALHKRQIVELQQKQQIKVYDAMLQGQEIERNRVARDLHDGLGGMLASVKLKLSTIANKETKKTDMELYKVITQLDQSVGELRRIARNMMPESLMQLGIEPALRDLCASLRTPTLLIEFEAIDIRNNISQSVQITLFRIVQELLSNAIKHADASNILVQCSQNENRFFLTVEDNGKGFDTTTVSRSNGIGLSNINNRVEFLKGKFEVYSHPGEGTTVNIEVNINE